MAVLIVLPVLPAADIAWTYKTNPTLGETVGWPQFVQTVDGVWKSLPPRQRASAVIFTGDYGEAGAINELGRGTGLPAAVSGQNSEWWWGPGNPHATTVVAVMPGPVDVTGFGAYLYLMQFFTSVRVAATLSNPYAAAPIPASSGKVTRHRLNPGGDRQANHALWRIVFTRLGSDPATRAYAERRTAEGKSKAEIIRCLKRYVAREVYPHLRPAGG